MRKLIATVLAVGFVAGLATVLAGPASATPRLTWTRATVAHVVDGDTVYVRTPSRREMDIRIIGINTPEIYHPGWYTTNECGGQAATQLAKRLFPVGTRVRLVRDTATANRDFTSSHRYLRHVVKAGASGRIGNVPRGDWGLRMIRSGLAHHAYDTGSYGRNAYRSVYVAQDRTHNYAGCASLRSSGVTTGSSHRVVTRSSHRGAYPPISTWNCPRNAPIKGNRSSMIYHMPGQSYYSLTTPEQCFATRAAAERAGYRAAKI
jgi:endonuclease YncB( thermonuclease family)